MRSCKESQRHWRGWLAGLAIGVAFVAAPMAVADLPVLGPHLIRGVPPDANPADYAWGFKEPVTSAIKNEPVFTANTDQAIDTQEFPFAHPNEQGNALNVFFQKANDGGVPSLLGHEITHVASPNDDMRAALEAMVTAGFAGNKGAMEVAAAELLDILLGTTEGRIYDGFSMLNFNRWKDREITGIGPEHFAPDVEAEEYKMKTARDSGEVFISPFDGEERRIWEVDIALFYYDGQIDSDTFLVKFPFGHHPDDTLHVNYRIFSVAEEDFSPTVVTLDRRLAQNTVSFPNLGSDSVWIAFKAGDVLNLTLKMPPLRMIRGTYTWGWRVHPPRIQFMQPIYEERNAHTGEIELDAQSHSFAFRNREELTLATIAASAPEMKMYTVARALLDGEATLVDTLSALIKSDDGPRGTWFEWADLAQEQRQLPLEVWDKLGTEFNLSRGDYGDFGIISAFLNNEMYGEGPFLNEIRDWTPGAEIQVLLFNEDGSTHYFRNVDFGARLHDDILRCCGGGETSFEIMNFKPSYGAPKVAEMQWRAGWGFRPHYDVIQQHGVFSRPSDRINIKPYKSGRGITHFGFQYSEDFRGGDFRFNPPPFIITDIVNPSPNPLTDADGLPGLVIGQRTPGYGIGNMCPDDPWPGFCTADIKEFNFRGVVNFPPPPLQGKPVLPPDVGKFENDIYPDHAVELRFPPFLRNPDQSGGAGDIIPPTGAWRAFLWINPANGTLFIDPDDPSQGHWADLTYSHGAPVFAGDYHLARVEAPRAAAQVFYQFDDLKHDNSIFSPHPVFTGFGGNVGNSVNDEITELIAFDLDGILRVRGNLSKVSGSDQRAGWVAIYDGPSDGKRCTGEVVCVAPVDPNTGDFYARFGSTEMCRGSNLFISLKSQAISKAFEGFDFCVQSTVNGFQDFTVVP